ncbi:hypothetical protein MMC07_005960 [Pseudocyphellaria aurata]|nr:hypothetical protein [Pseudocyphellaria aurata]
MAPIDATIDVPLLKEQVFVPRKRFKTTELPLNSTQRSTIDGLLHTIKKKGEYDALRKKVWSQYADSSDKIAFNSSLNDLAEAEIDRDPSLLSRDRGKAATLMQGAVDRSDIYKSVELSLDTLIEQNIHHVYDAGREIRKTEVGEDVAVEEEKRGAKTDEEYAQESTIRREARERARQQEEARKRREEEKERLRAEEKKKRLELEKLRSVDEKRREEEAKEERREKERDAQRALLRQLEQEKEAEKRERYERRKREALERERDRHRSRERVRSRFEDSEKDQSGNVGSHAPLKESPPAPTPPPPVDEKALEEAALELLLRESRELAAKSGAKPNQERSESLDPPYRKPPHHAKGKYPELLPPRIASPLRSPLGRPDSQAAAKLTFSNTNVLREISKSVHHAHSRSRSPDLAPAQEHATLRAAQTKFVTPTLTPKRSGRSRPLHSASVKLKPTNARPRAAVVALESEISSSRMAIIGIIIITIITITISRRGLITVAVREAEIDVMSGQEARERGA